LIDPLLIAYDLANTSIKFSDLSTFYYIDICVDNDVHEWLSRKWIAVFSIKNSDGELENYAEIIEIFVSNSEMIYGTIYPQNRYIPKRKKKPNILQKINGNNDESLFRLKGKLVNQNLLQGEWYHPGGINAEGYFILSIKSNGASIENYAMEGLWIGYSNSEAQVKSGQWFWVTYDETTFERTIKNSKFIDNLKKTEKGKCFNQHSASKR
jgi:hypothetical protein